MIDNFIYAITDPLALTALVGCLAMILVIVSGFFAKEWR